ncbi:MAG: hypothetical protein HN750_11360, partial [Gemmatimonadales bacterium]|nr:hypothetical protein [Gemmatimonadales bacterium]
MTPETHAVIRTAATIVAAVALVVAAAEYESELIADRARMTHRRRRMVGKRAGSAPELPAAVRSEIAACRRQG